MKIPEDFGEKVRTKREVERLSAASLSRRCSPERRLTEWQIYAIELGKRRPTPLDAEALALAFGVPVSELTGVPYQKEAYARALDAGA